MRWCEAQMECKDYQYVVTQDLRYHRFRWVFCQVEVLKKCPPIRKTIRKALENLPVTLDETYARVLESIEDETCQELARRCLLWLAFSRAPSRLEELAEAAMLDNRPFDPEDRISDPQFIFDLLGSLIIIASTKYIVEDFFADADVFRDYDIQFERFDSVRLAHFSVKEYLMSERIARSAVINFALNAIMAHRHIAETCLSYLDFYQQLGSRAMPRLTSPIEKLEDLEAQSESYEAKFFVMPLYIEFPDKLDLTGSAGQDLSSYPLLQYACHFWWHLRQIPLIKPRELDHIIWKLFPENTIRALPTWLMTRACSDGCWRNNRSTLHFFSLFGVEGPVQLQLERGAHINARNRGQQTALNVAARFAHPHIVRLLLEHGAETSVEDKSGFNPIMAALLSSMRSSDASIDDSLATAQLLLEHEDKMRDYEELRSSTDNQNLSSGNFINKAFSDKNRRLCWMTPFHVAAFYGNLKLCKLLLEHGADMEAQNILGWTVLHHFIMPYSSLELLGLLVDHRADILARTDNGKTTLELAKEIDASNLDLINATEEKVENAIQKYDEAARQAMETARRARRKAEIRRLMIEYPINPPIYEKGKYSYKLWSEFYD